MELTERQHHEIWQAIRHLEEKQMSQQKEIDALTGQVTSVTQTIQTFIANEQSTNLEALTTAISDLTAAAASLTPAPKPSKTVYTFTPSEGVEPNAEFTASAFQIPPTLEPDAPAVPLEYFSGDTEPGQENGASIPGYTVYTGPVQAVPAA